MKTNEKLIIKLKILRGYYTVVGQTSCSHVSLNQPCYQHVH